MSLPTCWMNGLENKPTGGFCPLLANRRFCICPDDRRHLSWRLGLHRRAPISISPCNQQTAEQLPHSGVIKQRWVTTGAWYLFGMAEWELPSHWHPLFLFETIGTDGCALTPTH